MSYQLDDIACTEDKRDINQKLAPHQLLFLFRIVVGWRATLASLLCVQSIQGPLTLISIVYRRPLSVSLSPFLLSFIPTDID